MTPDEATVALYNCIYTNGRNTTLEEIQRYVEAGAHLHNVETQYGPPLLFALECLCELPILKYLIEKGGIDWEYKKGRYIHLSEDDPAWFAIKCITYHSIKNELIRTWHHYKVTYKDLNQELINMFKIHAIPEKRYKKYLLRVPTKDDKDKEEYYVYTTVCNARRRRVSETYLEQICELFGVTPEELENGVLDLPDTVLDTSLLPVEDKPFCWNQLKDNPQDKLRGCFFFAELPILKRYNQGVDNEYSNEYAESNIEYSDKSSESGESDESNTEYSDKSSESDAEKPLDECGLANSNV